MDPIEYVRLAELEHKHWWYLGHHYLMERLLRRSDRPTNAGRILDAGCGTGGALSWINGFDRGYGVELDDLAVSLAQKGGHHRISLATVTGLPFARETFDVVTCFDVLQHADVFDDIAALREFERVLVPGGILLLRLPALEWLGRSPHDVAVHTIRRYTRSEVARKIVIARMDPGRVTYANSLLAVPQMLWRLLGKVLHMRGSSDVVWLGSAINRVLTALLRFETHVLEYMDFPIGLSVIAVAKKQIS